MNDSTTVNDQILDSVKQVQQTLLNLGVSTETSQAMVLQTVTQSISLAMQNAVAQQQQAYTLRNAITAAAAKAILEASPAEALAFAKEALSGDEIASTLSELQELMEKAYETFAEAPDGAPQEAKKDSASAAPENPKRRAPGRSKTTDST